MTELTGTETVPASSPVPVADPPGFDIRNYLSGAAIRRMGSANIIMQLSWPEVGYGVFESKVDSGNGRLHPFKRGRTTASFIAVAMLGTDPERQAYRKAVNGQHAQVTSDENSPVTYRAMDPELQLWVGACLYYGLADALERMRGPMDDATAEAFYRHAARMCTALQVKPEMWPEDRAAFHAYWEANLDRVSIDDVVRGYLYEVMGLRHFPRIFWLLARKNRFVTTGLLPEVFREQMRLPWSEAKQRRHDRMMRRTGRIERLLPQWMRVYPFNLYLLDVRSRLKRGRPLV